MTDTAPGGQGEHAPARQRILAVRPVRMHGDVSQIPVIHACPFQLAIVQAVTERLHQMQRAAGIGGKTQDIACIGGDFRLI